nr:virion morphogenesis protein [Saccharospirillaceae bacterium]
MSNDLTALEDWVSPLLAKLSASQRRSLARKVAQDLRRSQRERIKDEVNPDGSRWEPRKPRNRSRKGSIRRRGMFARMRTAKYMKIETSPNGFAIAFTGRVGRIARIHHYGLRDNVSRDGAVYHYPERQLLGVSTEDNLMIQDAIIDHLSSL